MNTFETSATVEDHGQVRLVGVPFAPGTAVEITIKLAQHGEHALAAATDRTAALFAALDKAQNIETVGALRREELYDRKVLR